MYRTQRKWSGVRQSLAHSLAVTRAAHTASRTRAAAAAAAATVASPATSAVAAVPKPRKPFRSNRSDHPNRRSRVNGASASPPAESVASVSGVDDVHAVSPATVAESPPLARFFLLSRWFGLDRREQRTRAQAALRELHFEATLRYDNESVLRAPISELPIDVGRTKSVHLRTELRRPTVAHLARMVQEYDEFVRTQLPQFDFERGAPAATKGRTGAALGETTVSFEEYAAATQELLRLATENPVTDLPAAYDLGAPQLADAQYPIHLLERYCTNLLSPVSPFPRKYQSSVHWWQMQAAMAVMLGTGARPTADRLDIIRAVLACLQRLPIAPQQGVAAHPSLTGSVYDYAIRHEHFFRTLVHAGIHAHELSFAASFLKLVPNLVVLMKLRDKEDKSADGAVEFKPLVRRTQHFIFEHFMAHCAAHIYLDYQKQMPPPAALAQDSGAPSFLPRHLEDEVTEAVLLALFPDMLRVVDMLRLELELRHAPAASSAAAFDPAHSAQPTSTAAAPLDVLYYAFRCLTESPLPLSIAHYNLVLFGLTHLQPSFSSSVHEAIVQCVETILRERVVSLQPRTFHILFSYCLRVEPATGVHTPAQLELLERLLAEFHALLREEKERPPPSREARFSTEFQSFTLDHINARMLAHASYALLFKHNASPSLAQRADALVHLHASIAELLPPSALSSWHRVVLTELAVYGAWPSLERFLVAYGAQLDVAMLRAFMERCALPQLFMQADEWVHKASRTRMGQSSSSMGVSELQLHWEQAKSLLSDDIRTKLTLPELDEDAPSSLALLPRAVPAAKYVIFFSRQLMLERSLSIDTPIQALGSHAVPELDLPPSVLSAPNFSTGWLLLCSAWVQHQTVDGGINSIKQLLRIVAKAADGSNEWQTQYKDVLPPAPVLSAEEIVAAKELEDKRRTAWWLSWIGIELDVPEGPQVSAVAAPKQSSFLSRLFGVSRSLSAPSVTVLDQPIAFKLHPQLLALLCHAFLYHDVFRRNHAAHWQRLFAQLAPFESLFDLQRHDPILGRFFQCVDTDAPFLERLAQQPIEHWPAQMEEIAKGWTPLNPQMHERGLLLLRTLLQRATASNDASVSALSTAQLTDCVRPFILKLSKHGWGVPLQAWVGELEQRHPAALPSLWPTIHAGISENHRAVKMIQKTEPFVSPMQLKQRGVLPIEDAQAWRASLRQRLGMRGEQ